MRVTIVDPSGFTPPHDHCLVTGLAKQGCRVVLATSQIPPELWTQDTAYERWVHFYQIASRLTKRKIRTYFKGCEHPFDMARLLYRLHRWRPDIVHF